MRRGLLMVLLGGVMVGLGALSVLAVGTAGGATQAKGKMSATAKAVVATQGKAKAVAKTQVKVQSDSVVEEFMKEERELDYTLDWLSRQIRTRGDMASLSYLFHMTTMVDGGPAEVVEDAIGTLYPKVGKAKFAAALVGQSKDVQDFVFAAVGGGKAEAELRVAVRERVAATRPKAPASQSKK